MAMEHIMKHSATITVTDMEDGSVNVKVDFKEKGINEKSVANYVVGRMLILYCNEQKQLQEEEEND